MFVAGKPNVGSFEQTVPFDEHAVGTIDQHVAHFRIVHQRLDRTEAVDFVHDLANHRLAVIGRQVDRLLSAEMRGQRTELRTEFTLGKQPRFGVRQ